MEGVFVYLVLHLLRIILVSSGEVLLMLAS